MEKWVVIKWDHRNPDQAEVCFEGSREHCSAEATALLKTMPMNLDCMALSEEKWKKLVA